MPFTPPLLPQYPSILASFSLRYLPPQCQRCPSGTDAFKTSLFEFVLRSCWEEQTALLLLLVHVPAGRHALISMSNRAGQAGASPSARGESAASGPQRRYVFIVEGGPCDAAGDRVIPRASAWSRAFTQTLLSLLFLLLLLRHCRHHLLAK